MFAICSALLGMCLFAKDTVAHDLVLDSKILIGNPLKDPTKRHIAIFRPSGTEGKLLPLVIFLPGFGGSSADAIAGPKPWEDIVAQLHQKGLDIVLAIPDGRNRFACSQYVNSPASGRYLDYVCDEVVPYVEKTEHCGGRLDKRTVIGHSSGGFGALRIGMARQKLFGGVAGLSPDSYFDVTHKGFTLDPETAKISAEQAKATGAPKFAPISGFSFAVQYALALCVDYAGNPDGTFDWLYDNAGHYRSDVYERWRNQDPAVLAERAKHPFSSKQRVYVEGAAQDDFKANEGAAKVAENLNGKGITLTTYFPPGHHADHLIERIIRGISWVYGVRLDEIH